MQKFIGTKIIAAKPMTRMAYNELRGWTLPADENESDEGYLVEYQDGGKPNHADFAGYISWSPKEQFENAYRETSGMPFGLAIEALKKGLKFCRAGWNGKGMFLILIEPLEYQVDNHTDVVPFTMHGQNNLLPWIGIKTADDKFVPWVASQADMLADDWMIVD